MYVANTSKHEGFGSSVLQMLLKTSIKKNLYYEIKDRATEEQFDGVTVKRQVKKCKVYGATSNHQKRNELIELLHQRVQHHRDKFNAKEIYDELCTMVVKPNGKVEHSDDAHDDLVFSYLWALYVFYHGEELATRFHLMKTEIFTDDHYDETSYSLEEEYLEEGAVDDSIFRDSDSEVSKLVDEQMKILDRSKSITLEQFYEKEAAEEKKALDKILQTAPGREAVAKAHHVPLEYLEKQNNVGVKDIGEDLMDMWYGSGKDDGPRSTTSGNLGDIFDRL